MKTVLSLLLFFTIQNLHCQNQIENPQDNFKSPNRQFNSTIVGEVPPQFPGGLNLFYERFFQMDRGDEVRGGILILSFSIDVDGSISDIQIIKNTVNLNFARQAIRILKESPKWIPGQKDGQAVKVKFSLPIMGN